MLLSMEKILERYERYSYAERQLVAIDTQPQGNWSMEYNRLKARVELLQKNQRHYMGEDLNSVSPKELQNLEQQLDIAIKHIRSRKNQLISDSISELQRKEKVIQEQNSMLAKQIKEREKAVVAQQSQWAQQEDRFNTSSFLLPQPPPPPPQHPCLNVCSTYREEATEVRGNELDLTLEPIYHLGLGYFAA
ncbi:hypothetical protein V6N11_083502 [Hibiscus sabdariffa]|uniref:K-box domain-containing protein n=1 Tax=Hibiscus sabdariffa TaxID=183260 RepID=A0ABR2QM25_9ROSI